MSDMYIVAYDDMFRSNLTIFRSLRAMIMQHIHQSAPSRGEHIIY